VITLRVALVALARNRLRSSLTILSIAIGMAAVVCTAALGRAGVVQVRGQIDAIGENFVWIRAGSVRANGVHTGFGGVQTMTPDDATAIEEQVPEMAMCSPVVQGRQQIGRAGANWNTRYQGVLPSFFTIRDRVTERGQLFTDYDQGHATRVLVLGASAAEQLFGQDDPIGQAVRMNGFPFTVVGVLARKGTTAGGLDRDDVAFLPLATLERNIDGRDRVSDIMCAAKQPEATARAERGITAVLRDRHRLDDLDAPDDFQIQRPVDALNLRASSADTLARLLTGIGAVALIIGGVGILNIMLVSVAERRREIGIRLAIGARTSDIRRQFLIEASALGIAGAAAGIALGWASALTFSAQLGWPIDLSPSIAAWAAVAALAASIAFGYFPAHLASNLDPLEVMRTEN